MAYCNERYLGDVYEDYEYSPYGAWRIYSSQAQQCLCGFRGNYLEYEACFALEQYNSNWDELKALIDDWEETRVSLSVSAMIGGMTDPASGDYTYAVDTSVTVTAIPDLGYNFDHWILDGIQYTSNPISIIMNSDHNLTAHFSVVPPPPPETFNLNITTADGGTTSPSPGAYVYNKNEEASVLADAYEKYFFDHWELDEVYYTENPIEVLMDSDHSLHAVFKTEPPPCWTHWFPRLYEFFEKRGRV